MIELRTVIEHQGEKEMSITKQPAEYVRKNNVELITYVEQPKDMGKVSNYITIQPHKVNIKRSGSIGMNQPFIEGKRSECLYRHPYGSFHLEIETKSIDYRPLQGSSIGEVRINYDAKINGEEQRNHLLTLTYMEES